MKSPVRYLSDAEYSALPLQERALHQANSHVGEHEVGGNNRGPFVQRILARLGLGPGNPWCATFVTTCLLDAGFPKSALPKGPAAVYNWYQDAKRLGCIVSHGVRGDLFFWTDRTHHGHIGFITGSTPDGSRYKTIEGNSNTGDGRDGDGVNNKTRPMNPPIYAIDMQAYLKAKHVTP